MIFDHDKISVEDDARKVIQFVKNNRNQDYYIGTHYNGHEVTLSYKGIDGSRIVMSMLHQSSRHESYSIYIYLHYIRVIYVSTLNNIRHPSYFGFPARYLASFRNDYNLTLDKVDIQSGLDDSTPYGQWFKKEEITEPTVTDWIRYSMETGNDI